MYKLIQSLRNPLDHEGRKREKESPIDYDTIKLAFNDECSYNIGEIEWKRAFNVNPETYDPYESIAISGFHKLISECIFSK